MSRNDGIRTRLDRCVEYGILRDWWTNTGYPGRRWHLEGGRGAIFTERAYTTSQVEDWLTGALSGYYVGHESARDELAATGADMLADALDETK